MSVSFRVRLYVCLPPLAFLCLTGKQTDRRIEKYKLTRQAETNSQRDKGRLTNLRVHTNIEVEDTLQLTKRHKNEGAPKETAAKKK